MGKLWKYFMVYRQGILALTLILGAIGIRVVLLLSGWPAVSAEEGTFGLEAMHIAYRGEFPVFMYGQDYMGTIEAYTAAILFRFFGVSWFTLHLSMVILFALFLVCLYFLTKLLYSPKLSLFTLALLSFGSIDMITPQLRVLGGAVETLLFGTLLLLLATYLSLHAGQPLSKGKRWLRIACFIAWGCCAGLGLWSHLLVAPFVLVSGLLLLIFCRRELLSLAPIALLIGLVAGLLPLILYNLHAAPGHSSLDAILSVYMTPDGKTQSGPYELIKQFMGTFLYSLPVSTGMNPLYSSEPLPLPSFSPLRTSWLNVIAVGAWSMGYILLFTLAFYMIGKGLWQLRKLRSTTDDSTLEREHHQIAVIYSAQLMLLLSAALTIALFAFSSNAASRPWSTRYLIGLQVALPAILWPLWNGVNTHLARFSFVPSSSILALLARRALLALLVCFFALQTFGTVTQMPANVADNAQVDALTQDLMHMGITRIYSGYWQCDRFIFQTQEKLTCAVVHDDMSPGLTRYQPYVTIVRQDRHAAYVFPEKSIYETNFERKTAYLNHGFDRIYVDGYVVYIPKYGPIGG